jgi:hypothetical protein
MVNPKTRDNHVDRFFRAVSMIRPRRATVTILALLAGLSALLFAPLLTYREVPSPDGEFVAIAKASLFFSLVPVMPGQVGDKPGRVTIVRKDGWPCGTVAVEMVGLVTDVRWRLEDKPRAATLVGSAAWNLDACTVDTSGW